MRALLAWLCLVLLLGGCAARPAPAPLETDIALAGLPLDWWRGFRDPALERLVDLALEDNLDLAIAAQRIREQRAVRRQAAGALLPSLYATGRHEKARNGDGHDEAYFYGLDLAWELDLFGRLRALSRAADAGLQAAAADYQALRVSLIGEVASTYLQYRLALQQERIAERAADSQAEIARITRIRFDQGTASGFDVERFDAQVAITRAAVPRAREQAAAARYALAYLLNREQTEIDALLGDNARLPQQPEDEQLLALFELPASSLRGRADVRAAELRMRAADQALDAARALRYPQLTLGALVGVEQGVSVPAWSLGGQVLQPLFDFGRIRGEIEASDARREQAWLSYQATLIQALRETRSAIAAYLQGLERQRLLDNAVRSSANAIELARRQYEAGTVSLIEVLDAERTQFDTQLDQVQASTDVALRWVEIYRTLGLAPPTESNAPIEH
ncbi:TolC family protein [Pseudomonas lopnurensis]|uniref:TolC family protein n=1 Tax=Pseudomonas lopnurensis TaxID=1477517 RepID=UPI0018799B9A|nr:TolC family protein [Pseudomonas lopnurensis]MBE7376290.1 TolC family protein [Pseudomonas lopnurensis]